MIRVLAIDDEPLALQQLATYIQRIPYFELVASCASAAEARTYLEKDVIDAIFIDINMPDLNGLDLVRSLLAPPLVVFTTAYSEYAIDGFRANAVHYLLKPFSMDEFRQASEKVRQQYSLLNARTASTATTVSTAATDAEEVFTESAAEASGDPAVLSPLTIDDSIFLKTDYKVVRINIRDIRYIESMGSYLRFHLVGQQRPIMALLAMKRIEDRLPADSFLRIHRSFFVNLRSIREISRNQVLLDDETTIPIGDLYRDALNNYLASHSLSR